MDGEFVGIFVCCLLVEGVGRLLDEQLDFLECLTNVL